MMGLPLNPHQVATMQVLERREADMQADYQAMLYANTPPDFARMAWAMFEPRYTMQGDGSIGVEERRGFFIDRDNGDLTPQQMAFAVMRNTLG